MEARRSHGRSLSSALLRNLPPAMDRAIHLLTLCNLTWALRRGNLYLIPYLTNFLLQLNPPLCMSQPLKMIHRADALCGMLVQHSNIGAGTISWKRKDSYFPPWILALFWGPQCGAGPLILSPDSGLICLALPRTRDMFWRALWISLQVVLLLCILPRLRGWDPNVEQGFWISAPTVPWCISHSTVHLSCFCEYSQSLFLGFIL